MKKYIIPVLLMILSALSACTNWLDVKPGTEIKEKDLFKTQEGFQDALIGVYIEMKNSKAYGKNLTLTTLEYLAQHWETSYRTLGAGLEAYDYTDAQVETNFRDIYAQMYHVIALANNILDHIDAHKDLFKGNVYELIKGEALGIRAYVHFDILRLFGPSPVNAESTKRTLPYVRTLSKEPNVHETYQDYLKYLEKDALDALAYLEKIDPVIEYSNTNNDYEIDEEFKPENDIWYFRTSRINYYALKGLLARYYLWTGKPGQAYDSAREVIDAVNKDGTKKFPLSDKSAFEAGDMTLKKEHLLAMHLFNLETVNDTLFGDNQQVLQKSSTMVNQDVFEGFATDARKVYLWQEYVSKNGETRNVIRKYDQSKKEAQLIPLLRVSELYLIAAETATSLVDGEQYFNELRRNRDITPVTFLNESQRRQEIIKEYRKEFYAEGQMFYQYKRCSIENILWTTIPGNEAVYVLPLPKEEINYLQ